MPNILSSLISQRQAHKTFFTRVFQHKQFPTFNNLQNHLHVTNSEFTDNENGIEGVYHHTVSADQNDTNPNVIADAISNIIKSHKKSLFFLTQKSRFLRRTDENPNNYLPLQSHELTNIGLMIDLIRKQWLRPDAGHSCMAITDENGFIIEKSEVSLRPDLDKKVILSARSILHRQLYKPAPNLIRLAKHNLIGDEIVKLARNIILDKTIAADLTIIPISQSKKTITEILGNIKSVHALKLYNLCSSIVKKEDIDKIDDHTIRAYVNELMLRASKSESLQQIITPESEAILAALACTHALVKACSGRLDEVDDKEGPDQDTQTIVVYCVIALIGTKKFMEFARKINFYDAASELTKKRG